MGKNFFHDDLDNHTYDNHLYDKWHNYYYNDNVNWIINKRKKKGLVDVVRKKYYIIKKFVREKNHEKLLN